MQTSAASGLDLSSRARSIGFFTYHQANYVLDFERKSQQVSPEKRNPGIGNVFISRPTYISQETMDSSREFYDESHGIEGSLLCSTVGSSYLHSGMKSLEVKLK